MRERFGMRNLVLFASVAVGAAGTLATLSRYVRQEMKSRGYPSWDDCRCNFKEKKIIFLVYHSRHEQRGETVVSQEWGMPLNNPSYWFRRLLHTGAQVGAILNPLGRYVERVVIHPQEAQQFVRMLHSTAAEGESEQADEPGGVYLIWRREVLHVPTHVFDAYIRRLYPVEIPQESSERALPLEALWDPESKLPLPSEDALLETPVGVRIDYIGWSASQISYCTMRTGGTEVGD